jgi:stage V sporulation protein G
MEISDIRVRLVKDANERLKSVCSITFDQEFVVRDVKIVEGTHGLFVAMPSRKLSFPCSKCGTQNHLRARFCNECGAKLAAPRIPSDGKGREKAHRDIAHPITPEFRQLVQEKVLEAYRSESDKSNDTEHAPASLDADDHHEAAEGVSEYDSLIADLKGGSERRRAGEGDRESSGRPDEPRRRRRGRRGDHDRDEGERPAAAERGHEGPETPPAERDSRVSEPAEADAPATAYGERDTERESAFGAGVAEPEEREPVSAPTAGSEPAVSEPVRATEPVVEPPPTDEKEEEAETEFGAGIL